MPVAAVELLVRSLKDGTPPNTPLHRRNKTVFRWPSHPTDWNEVVKLNRTAISLMFLPEQSARGSSVSRAGFEFLDEGFS
jgi:hypothetical protein